MMEPVKCVRCNAANQPGYSFCIKCGAPLPTSSSMPSSNEEEIRRLRQMVSYITGRLDVLEKKPQAPATPAQESKPSVPLEKIDEPIVQKPKPVETPPPPPPPVKEPVRAPKPVAALKTGQKKELEWEQILGGNWLARIGVLALIFGIGFFFKYAFDNNWIGPEIRITLGSIAGLIMIGLGFWWRKRYPVLTQVLTGGGIAVFYLSIFAACSTYHLISIYIATALLLALSVLASLLAMHYNSIALSVIGIFGGYFAPFILGAFGEGTLGSGSVSQAVFLIIYIIIIGLGILVLSTFRTWRWLTLLGLACSLITYGFWYQEFHWTVNTGAAELGITAIFLIFAGATSLFHIIRRIIPGVSDYFLMLLTAAAYTGISFSVMWDDYGRWMGGFTFLLAIFYGLIAYFVRQRNPGNSRLSRYALAIGLVLLTVAIPVQFRDHAAATIAFAAEGLALMWLAFREKFDLFRYFSYISFSAMVVRLFVFDTAVENSILTPVFNERFLAFMFSIASAWLVAYLLWKNRELSGGSGYPVFVFGASFFTLWVTGAEILNYTEQLARLSGTTLELLILLALAAITILRPLIWRRGTETIDTVIMVMNAIGYAVITCFIWNSYREWMGLASLIFAVIYGILTYYLIKRNENSQTPVNIALVITMIFLSVAIPVQFQDGIITPILWAVEKAALTWLSFRLKLPFMRYFSYVVFMAIFWDLLVVKTVNTESFTPVINPRFLAYIITIGAAYFDFSILWKRKQRLVEWPFVALYLLIATNFLTLWLFSFEVWDSFVGAVKAAGSAGQNSLKDAQNLALTGVWAVYAVTSLVVGIWRHWRWIRVGSLVLLAITILKVFVYDVFQLETAYRIVAFVGLGLLLVANAYLYQRFSKTIKGVLLK